jgi:ribosomal protein S18 acetylase RimI-like enzyme
VLGRRGTVTDVTDAPTDASSVPAGSGLRVRPSREEDGPILRAIDAATWSSLVSPAPAPPDDAPFFSERVRPEDVLVCEVEGTPERGVGGYVGITQDIPVPSHAHVLQVGGIAVAPWAQGRGVGQALVEAAVDEARRRGAAKLTLRVLGGNGAARRLYERCGFVVEGVLAGEFVLDGVAVDDVLMARHLASTTCDG